MALTLGWLNRIRGRTTEAAPRRGREPLDHIILIDGTMSTLEPGYETNIGMIYRLLREQPAGRVIFYEAGIQWHGLRRGHEVLIGTGINRQIRRAYGYLASHYRPGDRIFLFGYSRGAFAVRSLAGVIDLVGLLRQDAATERNIMAVYRHYQTNPRSTAARAFAERNCHAAAPIEMIGVFDTVKALGLRWPIIWRWLPETASFHSTEISSNVKAGFHALAIDETRLAYEPVLWSCQPGQKARVEQHWFRGAHGDIGGHIGDFTAARPLANIPLTWMLKRAVDCGLSLPEGWPTRFPTDPTAPMLGTWRGYSKLFLRRRRRVPLGDPSERFDESAAPPAPIRRGGAKPTPAVAG